MSDKPKPTFRPAGKETLKPPKPSVKEFPRVLVYPKRGK